MEDQHPVADLLHLGEQMRAQQDSRAALAGDLPDEREHLPLAGWIEPEQEIAAALRRLLAAEVPVLGLAVEGGRLSDAFLKMTEEK